MIYTFITDSKNYEYFMKNRDCRFWQPLSLITEEISSYIFDSKNPEVCRERFAAYSLLFSAAERFFGVRIKEILRGERGKPYVSKYDGDGKIFFSISHSDGLCAVTVSDEGEVGVDIQSEPNPDTAKRLYGKYFEGISFEQAEPFSEITVACPIDGGDFDFSKSLDENFGVSNLKNAEKNEDTDLLTKKFLEAWTISEALLKLGGVGFSEIGKLGSYLTSKSYFLREFYFYDRLFNVSVAKDK